MSPVKTRDLNQVLHCSPIEVYKLNGELVKKERSPASNAIFRGRQETVSEGHRKNRKTGKYDSGGPFFSVRVEPKFNFGQLNLKYVSGAEYFQLKGPGYMPIPSSGTEGWGFERPSQDDSYLDAIGAEAISAVDPTNPNASTGIALGEILLDKRLSFPAISAWQNRTEVAKAAGSEYLSAQFGWKPLLNDIHGTAQSIRDANTIIENYRAGAERWVHREFEFDPIVDVHEEVVNPATHLSYTGEKGGTVSGFLSTPVPLTRTVKTTTRRWFSGSFTYAAHPTSDSPLSVNSDVEKLFGITPDPDLIWQLTPWTWAANWLTNIGSVVHNIDSFALAGLVMKYGYIMEETSSVVIYSMPDTGLIDHFRPPDSLVYITVKRRRPANPFGFGLTWDGLSPTQLAIAAALGITHLL